MSRSIKVLWIVIGCIFAAGVVLTAMGLALGGSGGAYFDRDGLHFGSREAQSITYAESDTEAFEDIDIALIQADVELVVAESYGYDFSYYGTEQPTVKVSNGRLAVTEDTDNWVVNILNVWDWNWFKEEATLIVYVPADALLDDVTLSVASGETILTSGDVSINTLNCNSASGNIYLSRLNVQSMRLDVASGDVTLDSVVAQSAQIDMASGKLEVKEVNAESMELNMASGNIDFSGVVSKHLKLVMVSGDADFELAGSEDDYSFDVTRISGDIRINGRSVSDSSWPSSSSLGSSATAGHIEMDVTSGSVTMDFTG